MGQEFINVASLYYLAYAEDLSREPEEDESFVYGIERNDQIDLVFSERNLV